MESGDELEVCWSESDNNLTYYMGLCEKLEAEITVYFKFAYKNAALLLLDDDPEIRALGERMIVLNEYDLKTVLGWREMLRPV